MLKRTLLSAALLTAASAQANVLTTIKPLGFIAAAITDGVTETEVLLPVSASPHDYSLKPSRTIFLTTEKVYTGGHTWTYVFTDANHKITSIRDATGFGDIEKEFGCGEYQEAVKIATPEELKKRKIKPRLWAAIARSPEVNQMMWASDAAYSTLEQAKQDALKQCQEYGGKDCQLAIGISNMCLGLASGRDSSGLRDYFGNSIIPEHAKAMAVENCQAKGGSSCEPSPAPSLCALPCDMLKDKTCNFDSPQVIMPGVKGGKAFNVALDGNVIK